MNVDTGRLVETPKEQAAFEKLLAQGLEPIPDELQNAARRVLAGRSEAYVSLTSGGRLSRWAAQKRRERRRARIAKESRRRNRR